MEGGDPTGWDLAAWLPEGVEPAVALLLAVASMGTSFITAAAGLGGGVVMLALLGTLLPPAALIPVHGLVQLGSNVGRAWMLRRHAATGILPPFLLGSAAGALAGGAVVSALPTGAVQVAVGLFVLRAALAPGGGAPGAAGRAGAAVAGLVSAALSMAMGATGPFVAAWLRTRGLDPAPQVATHALLMMTQHGLKCLAFGLFGFAFRTWGPLAALMIATGLIGTALGRRALLRLPERAFRLILGAVLLVLGVRLIASGLGLI